MGHISSSIFICRTIIFLVVLNFSCGLAHLQLSPDSEVSYDEEYKLFQAEEDDSEETSHSHLSRQKRFVYLNVSEAFLKLCTLFKRTHMEMKNSTCTFV